MAPDILRGGKKGCVLVSPKRLRFNFFVGGGGKGNVPTIPLTPEHADAGNQARAVRAIRP